MQAMKIQAEFNEAITPVFGKVVGYKAGLTNPSVQKVFGVTAPVRGTLMEKMILKSGTTIEANFGARPLYEGDLILRVGSDAINGATTPMEALRSIDAAIPFIELPDLVYAKDVKINGPLLAAVNVAARYGIVGEPIPVQATPEWMERLKTFKCQIYDEKGTMLIEGPGIEPPGSPDERRALDPGFPQGRRHRAEERGPAVSRHDHEAHPTAPNTTVFARYVGLDPKGHVVISVNFK